MRSTAENYAANRSLNVLTMEKINGTIKEAK